MESRSTPELESIWELDRGTEAVAPGLLLASAPSGRYSTDRVEITKNALDLGRGTHAQWRVDDRFMSKRHARFWRDGHDILVRDLDSANGVFVNGQRLHDEPRRLHPQHVVRCGRCLLVVTGDVMPHLMLGSLPPAHGMVGQFYSPLILSALSKAALTGRHLLLSGESGAGKELAAGALNAILQNEGRANGKLVAYNCARITGRDEATTTIFGVASGTFTGIGPRAGLLERAADGVLLLDEVHVLPLQVQRSLLRFAEDGIFSRIGETQSRHIELTMICCTNLNLHKPESRSRMAHDLASRLHHVEIPPLDQRRADVAEIFAHHLENAATQVGLATDALKSFLTASHLEAISLLCFTERNVRELIHLAEAVAAQVRLTDGNPAEILSRILAERYPDNPVVRRSHGQLGKAMNHPVVPRRGVSHYEQHRTLIVELFKQNGGNLSATVRALKSKGIKTSRRWLNLYLQKWGQR